MCAHKFQFALDTNLGMPGSLSTLRQPEANIEDDDTSFHSIVNHLEENRKGVGTTTAVYRLPVELLQSASATPGSVLKAHAHTHTHAHTHARTHTHTHTHTHARS